MNQKVIGKKIRQLRKGSGISQEDLSAKAKIANRALQRIESGKGNPTISTLEAIAGVLKVSLTDFFEETTQSPNHLDLDFAFEVLHALETQAQDAPALRSAALWLILGKKEHLEELVSLLGSEHPIVLALSEAI